MKKSLEKRILVFSFLILTLTIAVNTGFSVESFRRNYRDGVLRRCETLASGFKRQVEAVLNLGLPLAEIEGLSKRCNDIVDNDPEIAYCLIENTHGDVLYYNDGDYPVSSQSTFLSLLSDDVSIIQNEHLGKVYDVVQPLYDFNDTLTGRLRIGFQDAVLQNLTQKHLMSAVFVLGCAFIAVFSAVVVFARRDLVAPIKRLCGMATEVSSGNFTVEPPPMRALELSLLSETLGKMAGSLHDRDTEIKRNYEELEETNLELQKSYERLEGLSAELGRSREMYRSLLDDASDAILVCDENDAVIMANKASEKFFGLPRVRIEQHNFFSFLETIDSVDIEKLFEAHQAVRPGASIDSEIRFVRPLDSKTLIGWAVSSAIIGKDNKRFVQIIVRDATREEETRHQLARAAKEMERLNQMKNSFLGLASHELKTPLTIIMGYNELLLNEMADRMDKETIEMVRHIAKASERLGEIVHDMVDVSMLDSKTLDLVSQSIDINTLVKKASQKSAAFLNQRKQRLELDLTNDLPLIRCDVDRMLQAIGNLLGNAIKFTPDLGQITIRTRAVQRPRFPEKFAQNGAEQLCELSEQTYPYVEIAIIDTGIGIADADQKDIFEKFFEVGEVEEHSTGKVAFKSRGAGLGLTIVKGVVALHGGAVWAESPGHDPVTMPGSSFFVLLPASGHPMLVEE
jgi:PAS domain S-box-containing protein